jgi:replicative DNA helicase
MIAVAADPTGSRYSYKGEWHTGQDVHRVSIRADDPLELVTLSRKRAAMAARRTNGVRLRIVSVECDGDAEECVCIKVTHKSSLYVTRDYVLTHNTGTLHTLAVSLARQKIETFYFALEMGSARLVRRMLGHVGGFNSAMFKFGDDHLMQRVLTAREALPPMRLLDCPGLSFSRLKATASDAVTRLGSKVFVLDYWQLVRPDPGARNRTEHLDDVAQWCADFAAEHKVTWLIASQENREGHTRGSDGLIMACDWHAVLHKHDTPYFLGDRGKVETLWMDVKYSRDGSGDGIGGPEEPLLYIDPRGPHLAELPR